MSQTLAKLRTERRTHLEVRQALPDTDPYEGRRISGTAVPFGEVIPRFDFWEGEYTEEFKRGAFKKTLEGDPNRVKFLLLHKDQELPLGVMTHGEERSDGLHGEWRVSRIPQAESILSLVADGTLDALSIGFLPIQDRWLPSGSDRRQQADDHVIRLEVRLLEVSLVLFGAYEGALVTELRSRGVRQLAPQPPAAAGRPRLDAARQLLDQLRQQAP